MESSEDVVGPVLPPAADVDEQCTEPVEQPEPEIVNGYPEFPEGYIIGHGRCRIFERIGYDDNACPTYLAMTPDGKELVLRVGKEDDAIVKIEAGFLCKAEAENEWRHFSQVHSIFYEHDLTFLALYFRGGPTLKQCFDFAKRKFSLGTAARLAEDVLEIVRTAHKLGYLVRSLDMEQFHLDAASRHLFMADISTLRKDLSKILKSAETKDMICRWAGGPAIAPMIIHLEEVDSSIQCRDEIESWYYLFVSMVKELPWQNASFTDLKWEKMRAIEEETLFEGLPEQFRTMYNLITKDPSEVDLKDSDYECLKSLVIEVYKNAGIEDHDVNYDFEREPTEEELPRFVLEKRPVDGVEEGPEGEAANEEGSKESEKFMEKQGQEKEEGNKEDEKEKTAENENSE